MAEEQRSQYRPDKIGTAGEAHLLSREVQPRAGLQRCRHRARQRHLQPVENPGDAKSGHDEPVEGTPREAIETGRTPRRPARLPP